MTSGFGGAKGIIMPARFVLVTGASTGIGEATALRLARAGYRVFAGTRRVEDGQRLHSVHSAIHPLQLDVTKPAEILAALEVVRETLGEGCLVGLVNNAGIPSPGPLETLPLETIREMFEVNFFGVVQVTRAFLPLLRAASGRGQRCAIANVSSIGGRVAFAFSGGYDAAKFALTGWSNSLRPELRPWGIQVALIEPGTTTTPIWGKAASALAEANAPDVRFLYGAALDAQARAIAKLSRLGVPPERVAKVIEHALFARWRRTRYLVGNARILRVLAWLPDRWRDALVGRVLGLPDRIKSG